MFRLATFLLAAALASLSAHAQADKNLQIAAAADLQPVLPAIIAQFQSQTGAKVEATYASSATLATQILNGAPFGLFLSADLSFPEKVTAAGLSTGAQPVPYARGTLVLWARSDSPAQPVAIESLKLPRVRSIAVANAEHAPYGRAAKAAIEKLGLAEALSHKLVTAENIAQTAQYADSGNADAGFISLTSALTPHLQADGKYVEIPANLYPPIVQGAAVIKGPEAKIGQDFLDFLRSSPVRKQLAASGLKAP